MAAHGCDVNERAFPGGKTFLHEACLRGKVNWVKLLLDNGALPHFRCENHLDASHYASEPFPSKAERTVEMVEKLLYNFALKQ